MCEIVSALSNRTNGIKANINYTLFLSNICMYGEVRGNIEKGMMMEIHHEINRIFDDVKRIDGVLRCTVEPVSQIFYVNVLDFPSCEYDFSFFLLLCACVCVCVCVCEC